MADAIDYEHMARALQLAANGLYDTAPNPAVGAVGISGAPGEQVEIVDLAGRRVFASALPASGRIAWEPRGRHGRLPPGLYFVRATGRAPARLVLTR